MKTRVIFYVCLTAFLFGTMEVVPCDGFGTYVPYSQVSSNEFFSTTQEGLERMLELKHSLLEQYPRGA